VTLLSKFPMNLLTKFPQRSVSLASASALLPQMHFVARQHRGSSVLWVSSHMALSMQETASGSFPFVSSHTSTLANGVGAGTGAGLGLRLLTVVAGVGGGSPQSVTTNSKQGK
jgi:hypothetical protein